MRNTIESLVALIGIDDIKYFWKIRNKVVNSNGKISLFDKLICKMVRRRYSAGIPISSNIAPFYAPHNFYGIFISQGARIGTNCTIFQHVTIGSNNLKGSKTVGYPTIKNNVFIGAGSIIVGGGNYR